ncbi:MAG: FAD:protein FMN transferase [Thermoanaerobaculia bacterium]|nr:FAD:protein FMN transferase [Thermoanaerobaculia bacterium]
MLLLALVPSRLAASPPPAADEARVERRLAAMGTELALVLMGGERGSLLAASEAALAALAATEARLSTWRAEGELARLNRQPVGEPFPLSAALAAELETAWACREVTAGAFEPALGASSRPGARGGAGGFPLPARFVPPGRRAGRRRSGWARGRSRPVSIRRPGSKRAASARGPASIMPPPRSPAAACGPGSISAVRSCSPASPGRSGCSWPIRDSGSGPPSRSGSGTVRSPPPGTRSEG